MKPGWNILICFSNLNCCYMKEKNALGKSCLLLTLLFLISLSTFSQNEFKVSGKVTDETGKPVQGATVQVKGTKIATATAADGSYSLMVPSGNSTLVITSIGFGQQEVTVNYKSEVNVTTASVASSLEDVVVTGYT